MERQSRRRRRDAEMIRGLCEWFSVQGRDLPWRGRRTGYRGLVAPPTLCTVLVHRVSLPSINLKFGKMQVHAGQRVQPRTPVVAGDQLTASSHLKDVYAKTGRSGTMVFIVWETTFRNQHGEVVADVQESFAARE